MKVKYIKLPPAPITMSTHNGKDTLSFYIKGRGPLDAEHAAASCNRCGACLQRCPSYKALKSELYSPRGRSQLLRFIFDRKLNLKKDKKDILNTSMSCLMCGNCTDFCPAKTPVAGLILALNNKLINKKKNKLSFLKKIFYLPAAKLKIKQAVKKQREGGKQIIFAPSFYSASQIKNSIAIINEAGYKAVLTLSAMPAEPAYFTCDAAKIKIILSALNRQTQTGLDIITDSIETYAILKKSALFGAEFKELSGRIKFISSLIKPSKIFKEEIKGKKIVLYQNNIAEDCEKFTSEIHKLLICSKKLFLLECTQSGEIAPSAAMSWVNIKGEKIIKQQISVLLSALHADYIAVMSYGDKKLFEHIIKKNNINLKVIHILQIPEVFYDQNKRANPD